MKVRRSAAAAAGAALCVLGLAGGVAYASIPGGDGVIHGCYKGTGIGQGSVYVIDSADTCPSGYTALNWNQTGISGYQVVSNIVSDPTWSSNPAGDFTTQSASCPTGKSPLGGGGSLINDTAGGPVTYMANSVPTTTGWSVTWLGSGTPTGITATVYAICGAV